MAVNIAGAGDWTNCPRPYSLKAIRYTLAAICLAASVSCLALWWRSSATLDHIIGPSIGNWLLQAT